MSPTPTAWLGGGLLLLASIYLGVGFSLVAFQFPGALGSMNAGNFVERMYAPIKRATVTFTVQTLLMLVGGIVLTVAEWDQGGYRFGPLGYVAATVAATAWTVLVIFPVNERLKATDDDPAEFRRLLVVWMRLHFVRFVFWVAEWFAIAVWLVALAARGRP
jgi:hypothetical protein